MIHVVEKFLHTPSHIMVWTHVCLRERYGGEGVYGMCEFGEVGSGIKALIVRGWRRVCYFDEAGRGVGVCRSKDCAWLKTLLLHLTGYYIMKLIKF
jgi:hypothetical protein